MTETSIAITKHWDSDALLAKAQRYIEEMLPLPRDDWKFGLWSSLSLELLARAALSRVSPTLLADLKDWNNLYHSLGHTPKVKKFTPKSAAISEVLIRLKDVLPDFDSELEGFCLIHIGRRNTELHSGDLPFDVEKHSIWLPRYYRSCIVLLNSLGLTLAKFVGTEEAKLAETLIAAAADDTAKSVAGTIKAHETVWRGKSQPERDELTTQAKLWARKHLGHRAQCPACASTALLTGEAISAPKKKLSNDLITETQEFLPNKFECLACGMRISGLSQLNACGLGDTYKQTQTYDPIEYYGGSESDDDPDDAARFDDDNNE